jgi:hypothetical protein
MADEILELKLVADAEDVLREIRRVRDEQTKLVDGVRVLNNVSRDEAKASRDRLREIAAQYTENARRVAEATHENVRQIQNQRDQTIRGIQETLLQNIRASQQEHATTLGLIKGKRAAIQEQLKAQQDAAKKAQDLWSQENKQLHELEKSAKDAAATVRALEREFDRAKTDKGAARAVTRIDAAVVARDQAQQALANAQRNAAYKQDEINHSNSQIAKLKAADRELSGEEALLKRALDKNITIYRQDAEEKIRQEREKAAATMRSIQDTGNTQANNYKQLSQNATLASQQIGGALNESNARLREHLAGVNSMGQAWQRAGFAIAAAGAVMTAAITAPAVEATKVGIGFNQMRENAQLAFSVILKDGEAASRLIQDLYAFTLPTAFEFENVTTGAQKLLAAGYRVQDIIPILRDAGNAAALGSGGKEDPATKIERLVDAFAKIKSKDVLQLRELNRITPIVPLQKIVDEYNKIKGTELTADEFAASLKDKEVRAREGTEAIRRAIQGIATGADGKDLLDAQAETFSGLMATTADTVKYTLGELTLPLFNAIKDVLKNFIIPALNQFRDFVLGLSPEMKTLLVGVLAFAAAIGPIVVAIGGLVAFIGAIVTGVAAFGASVVFLTGAATVMAGISALFSTAIAAISSAIAAMLPWIAGILAAFYVVYVGVSAYWEDFKAGFAALATFLVSQWTYAWGEIKGIAGAAWVAVLAILKPINEAIIETFGVVIAWFQQNWPLITQTARGAFELFFNIVKTILGAIYSFWQNWGDEILAVLTPLWNSIVEIVKTAIYIVLETISVVLNLINGNWEEFFRGLGRITGAFGQLIVKLIVNIVSALLNLVWGLIKGIGSAIAYIYNWLVDQATKFWLWLFDLWDKGIDNLINLVWRKAVDMGNAAASFWNSFWSGAAETGFEGVPSAAPTPALPAAPAVQAPAEGNPALTGFGELDFDSGKSAKEGKEKKIATDTVAGAINKLNKAVNDLKSSLGLLSREELDVLKGDFTHIGIALKEIKEAVPPIGGSIEQMAAFSAGQVEKLSQALDTLRIHSFQFVSGEFHGAMRKNATEEQYLMDEFKRKYVDTGKASTDELDAYRAKAREQKYLKDLQVEQKMADYIEQMNRRIADSAYENDPFRQWEKSLLDLKRKQDDFRREMFEKWGGGDSSINPFAAVRDTAINDFNSNTDAANGRDQAELLKNVYQQINNIRLNGSRETWQVEEVARARAREAFQRDEISKIQDGKDRIAALAAFDEAIQKNKELKIANFREDLKLEQAKLDAERIIDPNARRDALLNIEAMERYKQVLREMGDEALATEAKQAIMDQGMQKHLQTLAQALGDQFRTPFGEGAPEQKIYDMAIAMTELGLSIDQVNTAFGGATSSADVFEKRIATLKAGKQAQGTSKVMVKSFQAIAKEVFFSKEAIGQFGVATGQALAGALLSGENFAKAFMGLIIGMIGELCIAWGMYHIAEGIAKNAAVPGSGTAEIAAGFALTVLGGFLKGLAGALSQGGGAAGGAAGGGSGGGSTSISAADDRARPIERIPFDTSGERTITIRFESNGRGKMVDAMIEEFGIVTLDNAGRQHRQALRKRLR